MARALGDFELRQFGVIAVPDVYPLPNESGVIILGSDGLWDLVASL